MEIKYTPITSVNKKLVCRPFEETTIQPKRMGAFAIIEQKVSLISNELLYEFWDPSTKYWFPAGTKIWMDGEFIAANWAKKIYDFEGTPVIFVPYEYVLMVQTPYEDTICR